MAAKYLQRASSKNWGEIRARLLETGIVDPVGVVDGVSENPVLVDNAFPFDWDPERRFPNSYLRDPIISEGLYFGHRAFRVGACAMEMAESGLPTWALVNAYHSSFFSMRAIMCLLGFGYAELLDGDKRRFVLVDVFPGAQKGKRAGKHGLVRDEETQLISVPRFDHRHWWDLFSSQLQKSRGLLQDEEIIRVLTGINPKQIPYNRNQILYWNKWFFDDLQSAEVIPQICVRALDQEDDGKAELVGQDSPESCLSFAVVLMWVIRKMLSEVTGRVFEDELARMIEKLEGVFPLQEVVVREHLFN